MSAHLETLLPAELCHVFIITILVLPGAQLLDCHLSMFERHFAAGLDVQ